MIRFFFYSFFIIAIFSGCVSNVIDDIATTPVQKKINFDEITKSLTKDISTSLNKLSKDEAIYITDFVNITTNKNNSNLGFLLSNSLKVQVSTTIPNIKIKEFEMATAMTIGKNGSKILSRDLNELTTINLKEKGYILVGTYAITLKQLVIFVKLIELSSSNIISTSTVSVALTQEIIDLEGVAENSKIFKPTTL